jgi:excisionase family DNA binding protein
MTVGAPCGCGSIHPRFGDNGRMAQRTVTISEAAKLTGLSKAAIRARIERGSLRVTKRSGVRRVPLDELAELGLLQGGEDIGDHSPLTTDQLLDRLKRQAEQIGALRAENEALTRDLEIERTRREQAERRR